MCKKMVNQSRWLRVALVLLALPVSVILPRMALPADPPPQSIQFAPGKTKATVTGKIVGNQIIDYKVRARAGQVMTTDLKASKGAIYFNVLPPGSSYEVIFLGSSEGKHFQAKLPADGDYTLRVYLMGNAKDSGKSVRYSLVVAVE